MKKYLLMAAATSMLVFSACNNDDELAGPAGGNEKGTSEITFDFTVNSGVETRSGRDLYSQSALQKVNDMRVYIFKLKEGGSNAANGDYLYYNDVSLTDYNTNGYYAVSSFQGTSTSQTESHTYKVTSKLPAGTYKFFAIGYEDGEANVFTLPTFTNASTGLNNVSLALAASVKAPDEVFSGISDSYYTVATDGEKIAAKLTLTRAVGGVLAYFKNIPTEVIPDGSNTATAVKSVAVKVIKQGKQVNLANPLTADPTNLGNVYNLIVFNLENPTLGLTPNSTTKIYESPAVTSGTPTKVANSVLAGNFVMPISVVTGSTTIQVTLCSDNAGATPIKTFDIKCIGGTNDAGHALAPTKEFALMANQLYSMGKKISDNNTDTDPSDPTKDDPIDLSNAQEIVITVDANWTSIHDLVIE